MKLYVIRHSAVVVDGAIPAAEWVLSQDGRRKTEQLATMLDWTSVCHIYHSPEPKAAQTAAILSEHSGLKMSAEVDLRELALTGGLLDNKVFVNKVGAYLQGNADPDFEDYHLAQKRIVQCVDRLAANHVHHGNTDICIVSHGRILSVLFSHFLQRRVTMDEWQSIQLPDWSIVDVQTRQLERGFFAQK